MSTRQKSPIVLFLGLLGVVFCTEIVFMLVLERQLRSLAPPWLIATCDALLITAVGSFAAWSLFVRPLQNMRSGEAAHAKAVLDATGDAIITTDERGTITAYNPSAERLFGYKPGEVIGKSLTVLIARANAQRQPRFLSWYVGGRQTDETARRREWIGKRKDGTETPIEINVTQVRFAGAWRHTCFIRDIADRKRIEESTRALAYHDSLTGLPNRALFYDRLRHSIALSKRHRHRFALLYLDLDGFKGVNDQWGHEAGDELLKSAAQRLRGMLRESDTVARMGGDEFLIILSKSDTQASVARVARKVIKAISAPFKLPRLEQEVSVSGSIGIAIYPQDGEEIDALVKMADRAMYEAKRTRGAFAFAASKGKESDLPPAGGSVNRDT